MSVKIGLSHRISNILCYNIDFAIFSLPKALFKKI